MAISKHVLLFAATCMWNIAAYSNCGLEPDEHIYAMCLDVHNGSESEQHVFCTDYATGYACALKEAGQWATVDTGILSLATRFNELYMEAWKAEQKRDELQRENDYLVQVNAVLRQELEKKILRRHRRQKKKKGANQGQRVDDTDKREET